MNVITKGQLLAAAFRPFLSPGVKSIADVDACVIDMAKSIEKTYSYALQPLLDALTNKLRYEENGTIIIEGLTYSKGVNDWSATILLNKKLKEGIQSAETLLYDHSNYGCPYCGDPECESDHK